MTKTQYKEIENYMAEQMRDSAHDKYHVYRVLNFALDIASDINTIDTDVLIAACLLHDIGREQQSAEPSLCHAQIGGEMAYKFLLSLGWEEKRALHVKECVLSHRYRKDGSPNSIEATILFDADKLEACGAIGVARSLIYAGQLSEPLYVLDDDGNILLEGGGAEISSFFQEYNYKLKRVYNMFFTKRAKEISRMRQGIATDFYNALSDEVHSNYKNGRRSLEALLKE